MPNLLTDQRFSKIYAKVTMKDTVPSFNPDSHVTTIKVARWLGLVNFEN